MRLEVTRRADLAMRAMVELDRRGRLKGAELGDLVGASAGFLAQAMTPVVARGWVRSEPGPTGGYSVAVSLHDVSVLDVVEAVEGPTVTTRCVVEDRPCGVGPLCGVHVSWARAREQLMADLAATALSSLR